MAYHHVVNVVAGDVAGREGDAEARTLEEECRLRHGQVDGSREGRSAGDDVDAALAGCPDDDLAVTIEIQVSSRERGAEPVAGPAENTDEGAGGRHDPAVCKASRVHIHNAAIAERARRTDDEIL